MSEHLGIEAMIGRMYKKRDIHAVEQAVRERNSNAGVVLAIM